MPPLQKPKKPKKRKPVFPKHPATPSKLREPKLDRSTETKPERKPRKSIKPYPPKQRYSSEARKDVYVLGISMSRHDRAACLLRNGEVVGAIGEERLDRRRRSLGTYQSHPRGLVVPPLAAITYVLRLGGISWDRVDLCVCGRSMTLCREALLECVPFAADRVVEPPRAGPPPCARLQRIWHGTIRELRSARDRRARAPCRWRLREVHLV